MSTCKKKTRKHKRSSKTKKHSIRTKELQNVEFYNNPPQITDIEGYKFVFLPIKSNVVRISSRVFGGNYLETNDNLGISHLLEHVLMVAWKKCYKKGCHQYLDKYGAIYNAYTTNMSTCYWVEGLHPYIDNLLEYVLSVMIDPYFIKKQMDREIEAVRNEIINYNNNPNYNLMNCVNKQLYKSYGMKHSWDFAIQRKNLKSFTIKQLSQFSKRLIEKKRMMFFVSGGFDERAIVNKIKHILKIVSHIDKLPKCLPLFPADICYNFEKQISFVKNTHNKNAIISINFPISIYKGNKDLIILPIITKIMGYGFNSLLLNELRIRKKLIYSLDINTETTFCGTIITIVIATMRQNVKKVLNKTFSIIKKYKINHIPLRTLKYYKLHHILNLQSINLNAPSSVINYYQDQYFYQIASNSPKLYTIPELTKEVNMLTCSRVSQLMCKFFNTEQCKICYTMNKAIDYDIHDF